MLSRIKELMNSNTDFAFETTLAAKSYVSLITEAKSMGYEIHLIFLWLESAEEAIQRVEDRVASGGHSIPTDVIRRRYTRGLVNFFKVYSKITDEWMFVNNSGGSPVLIANRRKRNSNIFFHELWHSIQRSIEHE
jgi:predicted ABC-type ATPase